MRFGLNTIIIVFIVFCCNTAFGYSIAPSDSIPKIFKREKLTKDTTVDGELQAAMDSIEANTNIADTTSSKKKSYFKPELDFLSNNVYLGRSDTGRTATFLPNFTFTSKWGFYATASLYYIPSHKMRKVDGGSLELGFDYDFTKRFSYSVSYSCLFYNKASTSVKSLINSTISTTLSYDLNSIISPSVQFSYNLNRKDIKDDVLLNIGVSHDFIFTDLFSEIDLFSLSPTFNINSGTQNFYEGYFSRIEAIKTKKGKSIKLTTSQLAYNKLIDKTLNQGEKFQLLDYEISLPLLYINHKFTFALVPTMALPRNLLPKKLLKEISQVEENFYIQVGIGYKF